MILARAVARFWFSAPMRVVSLVALVAASVIVYAGTWIGLGRVSDTTDTIYDSLRMYDFEVRTAPVSPTRVPPAAGLAEVVPGVSDAAWRLVTPGIVRLPTGEQAAAAVGSLPDAAMPAVAAVRVVRGDWLDAAVPRGVVVDKTFAEDNGLAVGSALELRVGQYRADVVVRGIGVFPEMLMASVDDHLTAPVRGSIAAVAIPDTLVRLMRARVDPLAAVSGDLGLLNSLVVRVEPGADREEAIRSVETRLRADGIDVSVVTRREDQYSVWCNANRLATCVDFLPAAVAIFDGVAFFVLFLMVRRMMEEWRRELGALRALGYRARSVAVAWAAGTAGVMVVGLALGALGSLGLAAAIGPAWMDSTGFPIVDAPWSFRPLLTASLLAFGVALPATLIPVVVELRVLPADLLRGGVRDGMSRLVRLGARLDAALGVLGDPERVGLRNLTRRPAATLATAASVAGTIVMAGSMYLFADGTDRGLQSFLEAQRWDALVLTTPSAEQAVRESLVRAGAVDLEPFRVVGAALRLGDVERSVDLVGIPADSTFHGQSMLVSGRFPATEGEVVIDLRLALQLGLGEGGAVEVRTASGSRLARITGIANAWTINEAYVVPETLEAWAPGGQVVHGAFVRGPEGLVDSLYEDPLVVRVLAGDRVRTAATATNNLLVFFIRLYGHFGAGCALLLAGSALHVGVTTRRGEFALLRGLGFRRGEVARAILTEGAGLAALAAAFAVPAVWLTTWIFQERIKHISVWVPIDRGWGTVALVVAPAALLVVASAWPAVRAAYERSVSEVLRERLGG